MIVMWLLELELCVSNDICDFWYLGSCVKVKIKVKWKGKEIFFMLQNLLGSTLV